MKGTQAGIKGYYNKQEITSATANKGSNSSLKIVKIDELLMMPESKVYIKEGVTITNIKLHIEDGSNLPFIELCNNTNQTYQIKLDPLNKNTIERLKTSIAIGRIN